MEKQISIIIPTYNMERYIDKCLDSLLIPELEAVEVLVVNDGSKDRSSDIAHCYAERYPDSIRVIDKVNGNYGSCINAALPLATGRYFKILDADDSFDSAAFSSLVKKLPECNEDVIITNHLIVNSAGERMERSVFPSGVRIDSILSVKDAISTICSSYLQMHRLAYRREVFERFPYRQTEGVSYTDSQWSIIPLAYCETLRCLDILVYRYLVGREGQTMSPVQLSKFLNQFFIVLTDSLKYYQEYHGSPYGRSLLTKHLVENHEYVYFHVLRNYDQRSVGLLREYDVRLRNISPEIFERLNHTQYALEINFPVFRYIREHNYPNSFSLPLAKRMELMVKVRLNKLLGRN